jgi:poly-gamma-glutamate capsule biosynthesis protein CapA/YwtB (metallophosphatase superfamily)
MRLVRLVSVLVFAVALLVAGCARTPTPDDSGAAAVDSAPAPQPTPEPEPEPKKPVTLLFLGDINMGRTLGGMLRSGQTDYPFAKLKPLIQEADWACAELEVQVSDLPGTVGQPGSLVYCAPAVAADVMKDAGFDAVWSANNHIWDYGLDPFLDTMVQLDRVKLPYTGIGKDLEEAYTPVVAEVGDWRIATLSVTSIFNTTFEGEPAERIAWADTERTVRAIEGVRDDVDFVAVNHHGGVEESTIPTEEIKAFNRACIEAGADLIIGGHPHVFQGGEWWDDGAIFYSVGNLVYVQFHAWGDAGLGLRVTLRDDDSPKIEILGLKAGYQPYLIEDTEAYRNRFNQISGGYDHPIEWAADGVARRRDAPESP